MSMIQDPATGEWYDDGTNPYPDYTGDAGGGGDVFGYSKGGPGSSNILGPGVNFPDTGQAAGDDQQRRDMIQQHAQQTLGRALNEAELTEALRHYYGAGGDTMRGHVESLGWASGGGEGGEGGGTAAGGMRFTAPGFDMPVWSAPKEFSYGKFAAPDQAAMLEDPGYRWREGEMDRTLTNAASSSGLARSGGFLQDLAKWKAGLASQEYGNVYNRKFNEWRTGYDTEAQRYERDWRSSITDYTRQYQAEMDEFSRAASAFGLNLDAQNSDLAAKNSTFGNMASLFSLMRSAAPSYTPVPIPSWDGL